MLLLAGLLVWAAHFFGVYIIGSLFPGTQLARWLVLGVTLLGVGVVGLFLIRPVRRMEAPADTLDCWLRVLARSGCALAIVAITYQGLPAILA
jgi:hypothetical protein